MSTTSQLLLALRLEGSRAQWRALDREFRTMVRGLSGRLALREELQQPLEKIASNNQSDERREDIEYVDGLITLLRQASDTIGREARGAGTQIGPFTPRSRVGVCGIHRERLRDQCVGREIESGPLVFSP